MLFVEAQKGASEAVLVLARVTSGQPVQLHILRSLFGPTRTVDVVVENPAWLIGSKVLDRHVYVVLLDSAGQPYRGLLADGTPSYFCGFINTLEIQNDAVADSQLYDVPHLEQRVSIPLSEVEATLRRAHSVSNGV